MSQLHIPEITNIIISFFEFEDFTNLKTTMNFLFLSKQFVNMKNVYNQRFLESVFHIIIDIDLSDKNKKNKKFYNIETIENILKKIDPSKYFNHAIKVASKNNHVEIVKLLLKDDRIKYTPLPGKFLIFEKKKEKKNEEIKLNFSNENFHLELIDDIIEKEFSLFETTEKANRIFYLYDMHFEFYKNKDLENHPIFLACEKNNHRVVELLLNDLRFNNPKTLDSIFEKFIYNNLKMTENLKKLILSFYESEKKRYENLQKLARSVRESFLTSKCSQTDENYSVNVPSDNKMKSRSHNFFNSIKDYYLEEKKNEYDSEEDTELTFKESFYFQLLKKISPDKFVDRELKKKEKINFRSVIEHLDKKKTPILVDTDLCKILSSIFLPNISKDDVKELLIFMTHKNVKLTHSNINEIVNDIVCFSTTTFVFFKLIFKYLSAVKMSTLKIVIILSVNSSINYPFAKELLLNKNFNWKLKFIEKIFYESNNVCNFQLSLFLMKMMNSMKKNIR